MDSRKIIDQVQSTLITQTPCKFRETRFEAKRLVTTTLMFTLICACVFCWFCFLYGIAVLPVLYTVRRYITVNGKVPFVAHILSAGRTRRDKMRKAVTDTCKYCCFYRSRK